MPDFWDKLGDKMHAALARRKLARIRADRLAREEAQSRGNRKDNQGGGGEAATPPITFTSKPVVYAARGADAPLAHPCDTGANPSLKGEPETYVGWRWWEIANDRLHSLAHPAVWEGPTLRADRKPEPSNSSGIYSLRTRHSYSWHGYRQKRGAYGTVEYSGPVVVGEDGFRGEVATIRSLFLERDFFIVGCDGICHNEWQTWPSAELVQKLEERYQVSVEVVERPDRDPMEAGGVFIGSASTRAFVLHGSGQLGQSQYNAFVQQALRAQSAPSSGLGRSYLVPGLPGLMSSLLT